MGKRGRYENMRGEPGPAAEYGDRKRGVPPTSIEVAHRELPDALPGLHGMDDLGDANALSVPDPHRAVAQIDASVDTETLAARIAEDIGRKLYGDAAPLPVRDVIRDSVVSLMQRHEREHAALRGRQWKEAYAEARAQVTAELKAEIDVAEGRRYAAEQALVRGRSEMMTVVLSAPDLPLPLHAAVETGAFDVWARNFHFWKQNAINRFKLQGVVETYFVLRLFGRELCAFRITHTGWAILVFGRELLAVEAAS